MPSCEIMGRMSGSAASGRRRRRLHAGRELRARLDQALQVTSREMGYALEWSEREELIIDRACAAADRGEQLERIYDEHLVAGDEPGVLVKLSAEIRACERQVVDLTGKVSMGLLPPKSERHVRAVRARWTAGMRHGRPPPGMVRDGAAGAASRADHGTLSGGD
jgi:hypothetical protein